MGRLFSRTLVGLSMVLVAVPLHAQSMEQLPAGVRLRITTPAGTVSGTLTAQSSDSVCVNSSGPPRVVLSVATGHIQRVERAEPDYPPSMLIGGLIGAGVGTGIYFSNAQKDRGLVFGSSVALGAVAGLLFPRLRWVPVPLR